MYFQALQTSLEVVNKAIKNFATGLEKMFNYFLAIVNSLCLVMLFIVIEVDNIREAVYST